MGDCKAFREEIEESISIEGLSLEARSHAGACRSCGDFGREHDALRRLVGGLEKVEAPADFEFRLRARMKTARGGGGKYNFLGLRPAPRLAWAAAVGFLIISASLYVWQQRRMPSAAQQASHARESLKKAQGDVVDKKAQGDVADKSVAVTGPEIKEVKQDTGPFEKVAQVKLLESPRRSTPRRLLREASRKDAKIVAASNGSAEFSLTGAKILISTSPESLRFVVRDEQGNTRAVPLRTVSFGSQELVAGANARARMNSNDKGGVW